MAQLQPLGYEEELPVEEQPLFEEAFDLASLFEAGGGGDVAPNEAPQTSTYLPVEEYRAPATLEQLQQELSGPEDEAPPNTTPEPGPPPPAPGGIVVNSGRPDLDAPVAARIDEAKRALDAAFAKYGIAYDPGAIEGIIRNTTYSGNSTQKPTSFDEALRQALATVQARATNIPGGGAGGGGGTGGGGGGASGGGGVGGGGRGGGGGGGNINPSDTRGGVANLDPGGFAAMAAQLGELGRTLSLQNQQFAQAAAGNLADPVLPTITVAGENLSPAIDDALLDLLRGESADPLAPRIEQGLATAIDEFGEPMAPTSLEQTIADTLTKLLTPEDLAARKEQRLGSISDAMARAQRQLLDSSRSTLAERGLIGRPGAPSGEEGGAIRRIGESISGQFAPAIEQAYLEEDTLADQQMMEAANVAVGFSRDQAVQQAQRDTNLLSALSVATGYSKDRAAQLLATVTAAGQRQEMLADLALQSLEQNRLWNTTLAQFSLDREKLLHEIRSGQIEHLLTAVQQFVGLVAQSRGGYI